MKTVESFFNFAEPFSSFFINKENIPPCPTLKKDEIFQTEKAYQIGRRVLRKRTREGVSSLTGPFSSSSSKTSLDEQDEEALFFLQEPKEWYQLRRNKRAVIQAVLPSSVKKVKNLIYIFRNREKKRYLIGKTGGLLSKRIAGYIAKFNAPESEKKVKAAMSKAFLIDVKQHPEHFDIGILYVLKPGEDLDFFETRFVKYKRTLHELYNVREGGGGGMVHSEEAPTTYAIIKPKVSPFTPQKYYPFRKDKRGCIRPQFSPGFHKKVKELRADSKDLQGFLYVIKNLEEEMSYFGVTTLEDPSIRLKQHAYQAEYCDPQHEKYDPSRKSGHLHPAMAANPQQFGCALMPVESPENINPNDIDRYVLLQGIDEVEKHAIKLKKSLVTQHGYNGNGGGGGPIARRVTKLAKRTTRF